MTRNLMTYFIQNNRCNLWQPTTKGLYLVHETSWLWGFSGSATMSPKRPGLMWVVRVSPVKKRGYAIHFESQTLNPLYTEPVYTCTCNIMLHVDELYLIVKAAWSDFFLSKFYVRCKTVVLFRKCIWIGIAVVFQII